MGVFAHGVASDAEFPGDGAQGQPFQLGLPHRLPPGLLGGRRYALPRFRVLLAGSLSTIALTAASSMRTGSRAARRRCWDLLMWWTPTQLTMRLSSGPGDQGLTAAHSAHPGRWFLGGYRAALVLDDEFPIRPFQHVYPQSGVAGTFPIRQQLRDPPVVLHRVVPGDLAGVLEAESSREAQIWRHWTVSRFWMLGLHRRGLTNGTGVGQAQFDYQPVLKGLRHAFDPALGACLISQTTCVV